MKTFSHIVTLSSVYAQIEIDFKNPHLGNPKEAITVYKLLLRDHCFTADGNTIEDVLNVFETCSRGCVDETYFWILKPYIQAAIASRREYLEELRKLRTELCDL